jgi:Ca2+-binding EF-hand superfamily protein
MYSCYHSEFITSFLSHKLLSSKYLIEDAFDLMDRDQNGYLDKEEIKFAMGGMELNLYDEMLK